jgi:twitching motility protein PilJ
LAQAIKEVAMATEKNQTPDATAPLALDSMAELKFAPDTALTAGRVVDEGTLRQPNSSPAAILRFDLDRVGPTSPPKTYKLPFIGHLATANQIRILSSLLALCLLIAISLAVLDSYFFGTNALQVEIAGDTLTHSQRLAKASFGAIQGEKSAFAQLKESRAKIGNNLHALLEGGDFEGRAVEPSAEETRKVLTDTIKLWSTTEAASAVLIKNEPPLMSYGQQLDTINNASRPLQEQAQQIAALKIQMGANGTDVNAASELSMLSQRISKNATELTQGKNISSEAAFGLGKDIVSFKTISNKLASTLDPKQPQSAELKKTLTTMEINFAAVSDGAAAILTNVGNIRAAKIAEQTIFNENEALKKQLETVQKNFSQERDVRALYFWLMVIAGGLAILFALAIAKIIIDENRLRTHLAEQAKEKAQSEESGVKQINERNQTAILRLMNELQEVADGNLTVQATVSEDMTGAIADSVNYTVEELRSLIGRINVTAESVSNATGKARETTGMLLKLSEQQSTQIQTTGDSVLAMASNITAVSKRAEDSSAVAQKALSASQAGQQAVQASLHGMNSIRDQIQDTAKRIKRLGESSQQIGEIVDLIGDITEQTNVLALNASIQAASAGEAGRGFTVVAEEVQRLAERSGEATKQVAALVRAIQIDTQDAVSAMARSTQGVVEGAKLADTAGLAITDISKLSQELAEIILDIAKTTRGQADQAQTVAQAITQILSLTQKTTSGTRETSQSTEELSVLAQELKKSVARFKVTA